MVKRILYIELSGYKPLPSGEALRVLSAAAEVEGVTDYNSALLALSLVDRFDIVVSNAPDPEIFSAARAKHPAAETILVTEAPMKDYSPQLGSREETLLDHVIANHSRETWTVNELRVTIHKILTGDIFGVDKYLGPGAVVHRGVIRGSDDRDHYNAMVMEFADVCGLGQHTAKMAFGITEELLMNAIYDAPVAAGLHHYLEMPRSEPIELQPDEYGELSYGSDGRILAISAKDPFGALSKGTLMQYLKKVLKRGDSAGLIDSKKGGAGLGLFKILYSSHGIVCNVEPGRGTEIMAIIDLEEQLRDFSTMARSIHYFSRRPAPTRA